MRAAPIPDNAEKEHLAHLTGFRAIAAYLVLIAHSIGSLFIYGNHAYVGCLAYLGMSIFFVLSGFVITYTYYDRFTQIPWRQATRDFAVARFARLYPLYILFLLWGRAHERHALLHDGTLGEKLSFFTLTQSWWNVQNLTFAPAWSISTECFFYLCFALAMLLPGATRRSETYVRRSAIIILAGVFLILAAAFAARVNITAFLSPMRSHASEQDVWLWFGYFSPYVRIGEFIAGACAARMFMVTRHDEHLATHQLRASLLCIGSCIAIITLMIGNAMLFTPDSFLYFLSFNFGYAPFLAYIFYACSRYPNLLTRWCSTRLMQTGGEISYSVYVLQFWIYSHVLPDPVAAYPPLLTCTTSLLICATTLLKAALYIILTTIAAYCSYRIIEVPSRRFLRKWLS